MSNHHPLTLAVAAVAAAFALPSPASAAQAPTVGIEVGDHAIAVHHAGELGRGPVRLQISGEGERRSVAVIQLKRGVGLADVEAADLAGLDDAARAERLGRLVAGGDVADGRDYATTIDARAREYAVVDVSAEDGATAAFSVGPRPSGARRPRSDVSIRLRDDAIATAAALPRDGVLRIVNRGTIAHELAAFRLKRGVTGAEAIRRLRAGGRLNRIGTSTVLAGLVSPGTVNRVEAHLRAGRYVLASLYAPLTADGRPDVLRGLIATARVH